MYIASAHIRFIKRFIFLLIIYSLIRLGFYFYHLDIYKQFHQNEIFESFILGLRFDVAAILFLNLPILFLALIPSKNPNFSFFERLFFVILNSLGIIASLDDFELFLFMGKRLSFDLFVITDDIWDQLPQLINYYWYFPVIGLFFGICFYYFDKKYFSLKNNKVLWGNQIISGFCLLVLGFIGIRGGLQHKSINVQSAFTQGKNELGHLVLNTPYHFLRTLKNKPQQKLSYFSNDEEAINIILNRRDLRPQNLTKEKLNVVLVILEGFSLEYMEKGYTPFLSELKNKSVFFPHHLANGRRSIEALPSLLCGLPSLLSEPVSKSIYQGNKFVCMPRLLKDNGYTNYFFHGGSRGTMGFESYTLSTGFSRYFSREDFHNTDHYDGTWGIYDGPYLEFVAEEIKKMTMPFMAGIFTLSSHQPYSVPKNMKGQFPKGTLEIHESIGYADGALRNFFKKIKNEPWFSKTVFVITADHTSKLETKKFKNLIGYYRVPLLIYSPGKELKLDTRKVTQHSDIPKTVLDLVGVKGDELPATSVSVMGADKGYGLNYADGSEYLLISETQVTKLALGKSEKSLTYDWDTGELGLEKDTQEPLLKAYLQYYLNGLINNNLSIYR